MTFVAVGALRVTQNLPVDDQSGLKDIKLFFMLNSTEHVISSVHKN